MNIISKGIRDLLLLFIKEQVVFQSWGSYKLSVSYDKVSFYVKAMKYSGKIIICITNDNKYDVKLDNIEKQSIELNKVIYFIDLNIEAGENYFKELSSYIIRIDKYQQ